MKPETPQSAEPIDLALLHGWGMGHGVWTPLLAQLGPACRPHLISLPGHGGAPFDADRPGLADWAADCLAQAPARAVWVGWSLGALVALQAACMASSAAISAGSGPARIAALVLIAGTPRFVQGPGWAPAMPAATLAAFRDGLLSRPAATLERFQALQVRGGDDARGLLRQLRAADLVTADAAAAPPALAVGLDLLAHADLRDALPTLRLPTLWLFGSGDGLVPASAAAAVTALMPTARTLTIDGAAHVPMLSHPAIVAAYLRAFLMDSGLLISASAGRP